MDTERIRKLAESAERRATHNHQQADKCRVDECSCSMHLDYTCGYHGHLNDFFYWSGKATAYRGIIAMVELATVVEDELDAEPRCP